MTIDFFEFPLGILFQLEVSLLVEVDSLGGKVVMGAAQVHLASPLDRLLSVGRSIEHLMMVKILGRATEEAPFLTLKSYLFHNCQ